MRRARRRQEPVLEVERGGQRRHDAAAPGGFGQTAVEADPVDRRMCYQERREVVDADRIRLDGRVEAAAADATLDDVPERDAAALEARLAARIAGIGRKAAEPAGNAPELVMPIRVVLARGQRGFARHAAEDQDACTAVGDRREALQALAL